MDFQLPLDQTCGKPIYRQISEGIRAAIANGRLRPLEKLPSTRDLGSTLNCSRFTVMRSYEELVSAGYITIATGSGAYVSAQPAGPVDIKTNANLDSKPIESANGDAKLSRFGKNILAAADAESATAELFAELNYGATVDELLPTTRWKELVNKATRTTQAGQLGYESDPLGYFPLRQALAGFLGRSRAIRCTADRIAIFSGSSGALDCLLRILVDPGDLCVVEEPGFPGARRCLLMHGAQLFNAGLDQGGISIEQLRQIEEPIKLIYVTPSYQDPSGVVMPLERRHELLQLAKEKDCYIVEDDFGCEYRYGEKPEPAIQSLDEDARVIYLSSFWKTLFPLVRVGYMILPDRLVDATYKCKSIIERDYPLIEQKALTDLIVDGHLERHIKRTRPIFAKRRAALVQALTKEFGDGVAIASAAAGMQMLVRFDDNFNHQSIISAALKFDVSLVGTEAYYSNTGAALAGTQKRAKNEFLLGFAHITEERITQAIQALSRELLKPSTI